MAKQTFVTGQVLTAAQMTSLQQTAMGGGSTTDKTTSYVLVAADAGTVIQMNAAGATTITVNTALFAAGDTVQIQNIGAGVCTVTAGTATVTTAGSLALSQWEGGQLYFTSTSASIFFDIVQSSSASAFVGASVYNTTNQTISNATYTAVTWDTERIDTDAFHSTVTNTSRMTVPSGKAGKYSVYGFIQADGGTTGNRAIQVYKNGSPFITASNQPGGGYPTSQISAVMDLIVGDYVEIFVYQTQGGSVTFYKDATTAGFNFYYLGA